VRRTTLYGHPYGVGERARDGLADRGRRRLPQGGGQPPIRLRGGGPGSGELEAFELTLDLLAQQRAPLHPGPVELGVGATAELALGVGAVGLNDFVVEVLVGQAGGPANEHALFERYAHQR